MSQIESMDDALQALKDKNASLEPWTEKARKNAALRDRLVEALTDQNETYRYNCYKVLFALARSQPEALYPYWQRITAMLASENAYHRAAAANILPCLLPADAERRFDAVFKSYFALLGDPSIFVARYAAQNAPRIAEARPDLSAKAAGKLLAVDSTPHPASRKDLLKSDVIEALDAMLPRLSPGLRRKAVAFALAQGQSSSPRTRKAAKRFLSRHAP